MKNKITLRVFYDFYEQIKNNPLPGGLKQFQKYMFDDFPSSEFSKGGFKGGSKSKSTSSA